jgi:hypothetical protein
VFKAMKRNTLFISFITVAASLITIFVFISGINHFMDTFSRADLENNKSHLSVDERNTEQPSASSKKGGVLQKFIGKTSDKVTLVLIAKRDLQAQISVNKRHMLNWEHPQQGQPVQAGQKLQYIIDKDADVYIRVIVIGKVLPNEDALATREAVVNAKITDYASVLVDDVDITEWNHIPVISSWGGTYQRPEEYWTEYKMIFQPKKYIK